MLKELGSGLAAGALGTLALNVTTYLDMALRGRASSEAPAKLVTLLADKAGLSLASGSEPVKDQKTTAKNRATGLGALLGYMSGLGVGSLYGLYRVGSGRKSTSAFNPLTGISLGLAVMAASDTPLITTGISKPKDWGISGWVADLIPHLVYGFVTTATYEVLIKGAENEK